MSDAITATLTGVGKTRLLAKAIIQPRHGNLDFHNLQRQVKYVNSLRT